MKVKCEIPECNEIIDGSNYLCDIHTTMAKDDTCSVIICTECLTILDVIKRNKEKYILKTGCSECYFFNKGKKSNG